jgi:hypothetical protein
MRDGHCFSMSGICRGQKVSFSMSGMCFGQKLYKVFHKSVSTFVKGLISVSVDQYYSAWAHFEALFVFYTFDKKWIDVKMHQNRRRDQNVERTKNCSRPNLGLLQQKWLIDCWLTVVSLDWVEWSQGLSDMSLGCWLSSCTLNFDTLDQSNTKESCAAKMVPKTGTKKSQNWQHTKRQK